MIVPVNTWKLMSPQRIKETLPEDKELFAEDNKMLVAHVLDA